MFVCDKCSLNIKRTELRSCRFQAMYHVQQRDRPERIQYCYWFRCEPGSSGSIVSGYGLDDRAIEVRSLAEAKDFSSNLCVQTGSGAHPTSCPMGTGGYFPGGKARPGRDIGHSPPSSAEVENEQKLTSSPLKRLRGVYLGRFRFSTGLFIFLSASVAVSVEFDMRRPVQGY
jgi:hypothetical protein